MKRKLDVATAEVAFIVCMASIFGLVLVAAGMELAK